FQNGLRLRSGRIEHRVLRQNKRSSSPVPASTATVCASSVLYMIFPSQYAAPRLTTSQQATPCATADGRGVYFHFMAPLFDRSSAYRMLGSGVTTYIVVP